MAATIETASSLIGDIREKWPAGESFFLRFGDLGIEVRTNDAALKDTLVEYYDDFVAPGGRPAPGNILITAHEAPEQDFGLDFTVKQPDPGKSKIKEEFAGLPDGRAVRKRLTGMLFVFTGGENAAVGPCRENPNQIINFINNRHIQRELLRGCLLGHAAAAAHNGRGLAMAGFSGMGKSTLALHLLSRGASFVSNDRLMIEPGGAGALLMHGVAKMPRINPGTALNNPDLKGVMPDADIRKFERMSRDELWTLEHKYDVPISKFFGPGRFIISTRMDGLVILNWHRDGGAPQAAMVDPAERTDLLPAFMKSSGLFFLPEKEAGRPAPGAGEYIELLSRCSIIEISGGIDFDAAADVCMDFLENGGI